MSVADVTRSDPSGRGAAFSGAEGGAALTIVEPLIFDASRPERQAGRPPPASDAIAVFPHRRMHASVLQ